MSNQIIVILDIRFQVVGPDRSAWDSPTNTVKNGLSRREMVQRLVHEPRWLRVLPLFAHHHFMPFMMAVKGLSAVVPVQMALTAL
jgi:hypothetical protein